MGNRSTTFLSLLTNFSLKGAKATRCLYTGTGILRASRTTNYEVTIMDIMHMRTVAGAEEDDLRQLLEYLEGSYTAAVALSLQTAATPLSDSFRRAASRYRKELASIYLDYGVRTNNGYYIVSAFSLDNDVKMEEKKSYTVLVKGYAGGLRRCALLSECDSDTAQRTNIKLEAAKHIINLFPRVHRCFPPREIEGKTYRVMATWGKDDLATILGEILKGADLVDDCRFEEYHGRKTLMVLPKT